MVHNTNKLNSADMVDLGNGAKSTNKPSRGEFKYLAVPASWRSTDRIPSFKQGNRFEMKNSPLFNGTCYGYGKICRKGMKLLYELLAEVEKFSKLTDEAKWHAVDTFERAFEQLWSEWLLPCTPKAGMSALDSAYELRKTFRQMYTVFIETREHADVENWFWQMDVSSRAGACAALYVLYLALNGYGRRYAEL